MQNSHVLVTITNLFARLNKQSIRNNITLDNYITITDVMLLVCLESLISMLNKFLLKN